MLELATGLASLVQENQACASAASCSTLPRSLVSVVNDDDDDDGIGVFCSLVLVFLRERLVITAVFVVSLFAISIPIVIRHSFMLLLLID